MENDESAGPTKAYICALGWHRYSCPLSRYCSHQDPKPIGIWAAGQQVNTVDEIHPVWTLKAAYQVPARDGVTVEHELHKAPWPLKTSLITLFPSGRTTQNALPRSNA